jgi:lipopolysaccharide biosynthesis glycosyltransferase
MRLAIATASNDVYYGSLMHLLDSLHGFDAFGDFAVYVLDVGLTNNQCADLVAAGRVVIKPKWDVDISKYQGVPEWFKAMTARPFLPAYIGSAELILWLDADIWVQDQGMLHDFVRIAERGDFSVCLELNRCYDNIFLRNVSKELYYKNLSDYYGDEIANRLIHLPMMNCGAFAMPRDHKLWDMWQATITKAVKRNCTNFLEQTALNVTVYTQDILPHFLPARYNWMACHSVPMLDEKSEMFVEPCEPHDRIGLIHLASGLWKRNDVDYRTTTGELRKGAIRLAESAARR